MINQNMKMKKNEEILVQERVSLTIATAGFLVTIVNITRAVYFKNIGLIDLLQNNPIITVVFIFSIIFCLSRKSKSPVVKYLQIIVFLINAAIALLSEYDAFHGMGFMILTVLLAYRYGMFNTYARLKLIFLGIFTVTFLEYSIYRAGQNEGGSGLNIILYLIFFISIVYFVYMSEIRTFLSNEKVYHKTITSMKQEKLDLVEEIKSHRQKIQEKEERMVELEDLILKLNRSMTPLKLKDDYDVTAREVDVLREFCKNPHLTTKEIGSNLNMGLGTVKQHFNNIFKKLKVRSRAELLDKCKWNFQSEDSTS